MKKKKKKTGARVFNILNFLGDLLVSTESYVDIKEPACDFYSDLITRLTILHNRKSYEIVFSDKIVKISGN